MNYMSVIFWMCIISVKAGRRLLGFDFKRESPVSKKECLKLCFVHSDCLSINFSRTRLLCEMNSQQESGNLAVTENTSETEDFIYISRQSISPDVISITGACSTVACLPGKRCIVLRSGKTTCINSRCVHEPPPVFYGYNASLPGNLHSNGSFTSESYVGDSKRYTCASGTVPVGENQLTCLANGLWETPKYSCQVCTDSNDPTGADYWGTKNVTVNGRTCQRWDSQSPHSHTFPNNPENFCRNPDNVQRPWCYTTDSSIRWEYCDIPVC
ncbi:hepatocyte growth factor-like protein [Saccostrea cucullata]|uniref:hepatocyte growth factor-like protein n=1 Tax=Saccostrea cuccullata TaxID=36930 RepID=UPI002ED61E3F